MRYNRATIAQFAREVGFLPEELPTATALAWVGSGGHPHLDYAPNVPGAGRYVGLWAIDTDEHSQYTPEELASPHGAARAARELTTAHEGFDWSAIYRAGGHRGHLEPCELAAAQHPYQERVTAPIAGVVLAEHARLRLTRVRSHHHS